MKKYKAFFVTFLLPGYSILEKVHTALINKEENEKGNWLFAVTVKINNNKSGKYQVNGRRN
jgi:hypothetical protein